MQIGVFYEDNQIFVKFDDKTFISLLEDYYKKYHDITKAIEQIEKDLKKKTLTK